MLYNHNQPRQQAEGPMKFLPRYLLSWLLFVGRANSFSSHPATKGNAPRNDGIEFHTHTSRRDALGAVLGSLSFLALPQSLLAAPLIPDMNAVTTVTLDSADMKIGVELYDVKIGSPPQSYPAVKAVNPSGVAASEKVQPGMIVLGNYKDASQAVVNRIKNGPYPLVLQFYDFGKAGEYSDNPIPPQEALLAAQQTSKAAAAVKEPPLGSKGSGLIMKTIKEPITPCRKENRVRRGDTLEINFEARVASPGGPLYDSSKERGSSVSFTVGAGEVVSGIDIGVYDMCPGEIKTFDIPAGLGYGRAGAEIFDIPGDVRLWWKIELLSVTKKEAKARIKY